MTGLNSVCKQRGARKAKVTIVVSISVLIVNFVKAIKLRKSRVNKI